MKIKYKRFSKSTLSVILALCMLVSCMTVALVPTDAAKVSEESAGYYWDNGNWYLKSDIDSWGTGLKMTNNSSNNDQAYKDIYLFGSSSDSNFNFKFKEEDGGGNESWFGPSSGSDTACGTSGTEGGEGKDGNYYINRKDLGTDSTTVYKIRIWFEHANWVGSWYAESTTYSSLAPTLTAPSSGTVGTAVNLSGSYTSENKVGTVTGTYQYSTNNGSTWNDLSGGSYTATSAGTVQFRYMVKDGGVVSGTNSTSNRIEYSSKKTCVFTAASNLAASSVTLSQSPTSNIFANHTEVTYTAAATSPKSGVTYNFKVNGTSVQNTTSNVYTRTYTSSGTYSVTVTVEKSGYDSVNSSTLSTTVSAIIYDVYPEGSDTSVGGTMAYDAAASGMVSDTNPLVFKKSASLTNGTTYYVRIWDGTSNYKPSSEITSEKLLTGTGVSGTKVTDNSSTKLTVGATGTYNFYYDHVNHKFYVEYPHTVTFSANGHGTAPSSQVVTYGEKATQPTAPSASGWVFGGWYKESGCTSAWNFSSDTVTADTTLYAKWTRNQCTITYGSGTGYTISGTKPTTAYYGDTISFTVTPSSGYRISSVKYTHSSGSATNCIAGSDNEYHFTMPDANVTVSVTVVRTYTVTLTTSPAAGFATKQYKIGSGTQTDYTASITVDAGSVVTFTVSYATGYTFNSVTNATASNSNTTFTTATINANTTVTVSAKLAAYTISASFPNGNTYTKNSTTGNYVSASMSSGNYGNTYTIDVVLADGYEVASITGTNTSTLPTPTVSGRIYKYQYILGSSNVSAVVTLKAKTPTISNVQIKNQDFNFAAYGNPTVNYYLQPTEVKATTESFATLGYNNTNQSVTGKASGAAVTLTQPAVTLNTDGATADYTLTITATNAPAGVTAVSGPSGTYTIRVKYNDTQRVYFNLKKLYERCIEESPSNNPYYKVGAPISAYNTEYNKTKTYINAGWPAYNAGISDQTTAVDSYNNFKTAYDNLMTYANTTKIRVLTKYANSTSAPINMYMTSNGTTDDWNHFKMYSFGSEIGNSTGNNDNFNYHMTYDGYVQKNDTNYYMYTYTYAGHARFQVWKGTSESDLSYSGKLLTGTVTNAVDFKEYYVNVYDTSTSSTSVTACTEYVDFGHTKASGKKYLEINDRKNAAEIKTLFEITPVGSIVSNPGIPTTNTTFTVTGPIGKSTSKIYDLIAEKYSEDGGITWKTLPDGKFPASEQGKYTVSYTTRFGYGALGTSSPIERNETMSLWVAFDDVNIYVDMNDNIGTPILNFKYYTNSSGSVVAQGTSGAVEAYLPYEMDLVTGSESIYKYTIKISKLRDTYKIYFTSGTPIQISYITVENNKIGQGTGFTIGTDARITGEVWLKADSTNLKTFNVISYGSVTAQFIGVAEDSNHTLLPASMQSVNGTGISTDEDDIYKVQYAGLDGTNVFHYVLGVSANKEIKIGNNVYYFDKWVRCKTPAEGLNVTTANDVSTVTLPATTDFNNNTTDLSFTAASEYNDGDGEYTYIAMYKLAASGDGTVRVEVTYNFQDFNTSDGNYVYDENKATIKESYTKTIKVEVGPNKMYSTFADVKSEVDSIARLNAPHIQSNYFDYSYKNSSAVVDEEKTVAAQNKIVATAEFDNTAHAYTIRVKNGSSVSAPKTGHYQEPVELSAGSVSNPVWKDIANNVLATGATYKTRFVASDNENTDCQIIKLESGSGVSVNHTSVISNSFTTVKYVNETQMLQHNFYIVDYCAEGELVGGGVLYATTDGTNYRQTNAATQLASVTSRRNYINGILNGDYDTEYKAQTINNVGFRYLPFKSNEDAFRYSSNLGAYITDFEGDNVNNVNYKGQKLRMFSFMVYNNNGTKDIVLSSGYAEVSRYIAE